MAARRGPVVVVLTLTRRFMPRRSSSRSERITRKSAIAFLEADVNGDKRLSFDEFTQLNPGENLSDVHLREVFDSIDTDRSGDISMEEYFLWTLSIAHESTGTGIVDIFQKYDKTGEGTLDALEFARAAEDMGFGAAAHELFLELLDDCILFCPNVGGSLLHLV